MAIDVDAATQRKLQLRLTIQTLARLTREGLHMTSCQCNTSDTLPTCGNTTTVTNCVSYCDVSNPVDGCCNAPGA